jgi:hypothetical protein
VNARQVLDCFLWEATQAYLKPSSRNVKTGPIPVSTTSAATCPPSCPLAAGGGCYATEGPIGLHFRAVTAGERGVEWDEFCRQIAALPPGTFWRHNQAGDLPGEGEVIDAEEMRALVAANRGKKGYTYTHKYGTPENLELIRQANEQGFTVNLSANNPAQADRLAALGIAPVTTVLPTEQTRGVRTPGGRRVVVCPAATKPGVSCATCKLCQRPGRETIIGFPAHGSRQRKASAIASRSEAKAARRVVELMLGA